MLQMMKGAARPIENKVFLTGLAGKEREKDWMSSSLAAAISCWEWMAMVDGVDSIDSS
jgi:hypothetical protein